MSRETGFYMDATDFTKTFNKFAKETVPDLAAQAQFKLGALVIRYALKRVPKVPREIGDLQASHVIEVDEEKLILTVGFNKEYAAKLHEAPETWNWTLPGSGPKYLESKLVMYRNDFVKFVTELIGKGFSHA